MRDNTSVLNYPKHTPRISLDLTRIVGCSCGWRTPEGTTDSDDAIVMHIAIARIAEGAPS